MQNGSINLAQYKLLLSSEQLRKVNVGLFETLQELLLGVCMGLKLLGNYLIYVSKENGNEAGIAYNVENFFITRATMFLGISYCPCVFWLCRWIVTLYRQGAVIPTIYMVY
jgi:cell division protein FtsW (lipid II flippase)